MERFRQPTRSEDMTRKVVAFQLRICSREFRVIRNRCSGSEQIHQFFENLEIALGAGVCHDIKGNIAIGSGQQRRQSDAQRVTGT